MIFPFISSAIWAYGSSLVTILTPHSPPYWRFIFMLKQTLVCLAHLRANRIFPAACKANKALSYGARTSLTFSLQFILREYKFH